MTEPYKDPSRSIEERVEDLLDRMTLEEKVGQMVQGRANPDGETWLKEQHAGSLLHTVHPKQCEALQTMAMESRLGIPLLLAIDAIHGHAFHKGATIFPTQLTLSCSWDTSHGEAMGRITAKELTPLGIHWTFSPVFCLARDLRWGRINETSGEDPWLDGLMGSAIVRGYQQGEEGERVLACAKHFAGYSETFGGRDSSEAPLSHRRMRSVFLPAFQQAVAAGCHTVMTAYQAIDGLPCVINRWLLHDILRDEWGFEGIVVTDWDNVGRAVAEQRVAETVEDAAVLAVRAGNDMMMMTEGFHAGAVAAVRNGKLDEALIDHACGNVLRLKFRLGLFENPRLPDLDKAATVVGCGAHRAAALQAARDSLVLLKNSDTLPLASTPGRLAVVGPNAHDVRALLGDWSFSADQDCLVDDTPPVPEKGYIVTVLDGVCELAGDGCEVSYARGCDVMDPSEAEIDQAVVIARKADTIIAVLGDTVDNTGETRDRANLDLSGGQKALLKALADLDKPLVVVLVCGKPLTIPDVHEHADAILLAHNPGMDGGKAVAEALFGHINPGGKVTISWPKSVGQQPVYYNALPGEHNPHGYIDSDMTPLYPFGHGLSYTTFAYDNLRVQTPDLSAGEPLVCSVDVTNTGPRDGVEITQAYINDLVSSVTTPGMELKAFSRNLLKAGESRTIRMEIPFERLGLINAENRRVVEPGEFELMVGGSSRREDLLTARLRVT